MKLSNRQAQGFSLIELLLALGIASFCLIPLLGLLPVGLRNDQSSNEQTRMANIATLIVRDMTSVSSTNTTTPLYGFQIPAAGGTANTSPQTLYLAPDGSETGTVGTAPGSTAFYRVSIAFIPPASAVSQTATLARVTVTWPALADAIPSQWPTHYNGILQTVVALDRN